MPLYKCHVFNDDHTVDRLGQQLADGDAARTIALSSARQIMAHELMTGRPINLCHWIEIEDEGGEMTVVSFREAIHITDAQ